MDSADKDNPLPEKSPTIDEDDADTKTESKDVNNDEAIVGDQNHPEKEKLDHTNNQNSPKEQEETDHIPSPHAPSLDDGKSNAGIADDDTVKPEIKEEEVEGEEKEKEGEGEEKGNKAEGENPTDDQTNPEEEGKVEEEESSRQPLDLEHLSEEIDQYILTLSASTKGGIVIDDTDNEITPPDDVPHFVQQFTNLVESKIGDYDSKDNHVKWSDLSEEDSTSFLESVNRLSSLSNTLLKFSSDNKYSDSINRVGSVIQRAMSYVEEEYKSLLADYKINDNSSDPSNVNKDTKPNQDPEQDPPSESDADLAASTAEENNLFPGYSDEILSKLIRLSKVMIAGGHETECCQVYFVARRNALEDSLQKHGFEKFSIEEVQKMPWESLEREVVTWITTFKQTATIHLPSEKKLSCSVFEADQNLSSTSNSLFCRLSQGIIIQLLNFAGAVSLSKRAAEKLFKFLDIYEVLRETLPAIEDLFPDDLMAEIRSEEARINVRLGEAMLSIFGELEDSIKADSAKTPVPGGMVHPLSRYIMNYLKLATEYRETLEQVFKEHHKIERADSTSGSELNINNPQAGEAAKHSPFQNQMIRVMDLVDANLDAKSKLYKDHALSSIFMMNNGRYILQKVRGSREIISVMGDSWCRSRSTDLRQYHKGYQRDTWGKLLHCLHPDGLTVNGKVSKPVLKERFKSFNAMFDEIHKTQSAWVVSDEQLQSELRISIANMVIPAYRSFLGRYSQIFTPGRQTEKYVKYQAEDIETHIDELFDGSAAPTGRKW